MNVKRTAFEVAMMIGAVSASSAITFACAGDANKAIAGALCVAFVFGFAMIFANFE